MKIEFVKKHLDHKEGDKLEVSDAQGEYLKQMQVAKEVGTKEKKELDTKEAEVKGSEKNKKAGPSK